MKVKKKPKTAQPLQEKHICLLHSFSRTKLSIFRTNAEPNKATLSLLWPVTLSRERLVAVGGQMAVPAEVRRGGKSERYLEWSFNAGFCARTSDLEPLIALFHSSSGDTDIARGHPEGAAENEREGGKKEKAHLPKTQKYILIIVCFCARSVAEIPVRLTWSWIVDRERKNTISRNKYQSGPLHKMIQPPPPFLHIFNILCPHRHTFRKCPPPPPTWHMRRGEKPKSGHPDPRTTSLIFNRSSSSQTDSVVMHVMRDLWCRDTDILATDLKRKVLKYRHC